MHLFRIYFQSSAGDFSSQFRTKEKNGKQTNPKYQSLKFGKGK